MATGTKKARASYEVQVKVGATDAGDAWNAFGGVPRSEADAVSFAKQANEAMGCTARAVKHLGGGEVRVLAVHLSAKDAAEKAAARRADREAAFMPRLQQVIDDARGRTVAWVEKMANVDAANIAGHIDCLKWSDGAWKAAATMRVYGAAVETIKALMSAAGSPPVTVSEAARMVMEDTRRDLIREAKYLSRSTNPLSNLADDCLLSARCEFVERVESFLGWMEQDK
jgi:hypothetical protein